MFSITSLFRDANSNSASSCNAEYKNVFCLISCLLRRSMHCMFGSADLSPKCREGGFFSKGRGKKLRIVKNTDGRRLPSSSSTWLILTSSDVTNATVQSLPVSENYNTRPISTMTTTSAPPHPPRRPSNIPNQIITPQPQLPSQSTHHTPPPSHPLQPPSARRKPRPPTRRIIAINTPTAPPPS